MDYNGPKTNSRTEYGNPETNEFLFIIRHIRQSIISTNPLALYSLRFDPGRQ